MENSLGKSFGTEKSKKNRALDNKSVCKNEGSANGKRNNFVNDDGEIRKDNKNKKIKKEALCSSEVANKRGISGVEKLGGDVASSNGSPSSEGEVDILLSLDRSGHSLNIPKRPRGSVGRKNSENNHDSSPSIVEKVDELAGEQVSKKVEKAGGKVNLDNKIVKSNGGVKEKSISLTRKSKLGVDGKKKSSSKKALAPVSEAKEVVHLDVINKGDASCSRKQSSRHRKRKRKGSEILSAKVGPVADENEDNLEENAARMLSSRFDPSCTQFSSKSRSPSTNGLPPSMASDQDFVNRGMNMSAVSELASGDLANRVLRQRQKHTGEDLSRRRRHFYEIFSRDVDAYWLVNRRIKVFWPLDESWYYGLVSGYNSDSKLHHITYDDQEEEWVNLQNEKFKLLLLPSEVPHKPDSKGDSLGNKNDDGDVKDLLSDDSLESRYLDSEPISSWLVRSSRRVKSSHPGSSKRHKTSHSSQKLSHKLSTKAVSTKEHLEKSASSKRDTDKLKCNLEQTDRSSDPCRVAKSLVGGSSVSEDRHFSIVYVRRRFRKKNSGMIGTGNKVCRITPESTMVTVPNGLDPSRGNDISLRLVQSERLVWSVDNVGLLKLTIPLVDCKKLRLELGFPVFSSKTFRGEESWLIRAMFLLKYGVVINTWPKVRLEILFVDNVVGLRFVLFEGSLKQAVEFVLLVMAVFNQPHQKRKPVDMLMPVTSIKFKLSCLEDSSKQHVFAVYSFSKVKSSKWLYVNSKLQQHCLLAKQLPLSECTYDNIKALESGSNQLPLSTRSRASSANEGSWKKSLHGIMPKGNSIDSSFTAMDRSPMYNAKLGKLLPFALSFSAAPSFFLSLHMKLLLEKNVASTSLHEDESRYFFERSDKSSVSISRGCTVIQEYSTDVADTSLSGNPGISSMEVEYSNCVCSRPTLEVETSKCSDHGQLFNNHQNGKFDVTDTSACSEESDKNTGDAIVQSLETEHVSPELKQPVTPSRFSVPKDKDHGFSVELPDLQPDEVFSTPPTTAQSPNMASNVSDNIVRSLKINGPRLMCRSGINSLNSSHVRPGGKPEFIGNGFSSGPKKPRTQVQYTLPSGGFDSSSKHSLRNHRGLPFHRIRKPNDKRTSDASINHTRNKGFLACDANVLITIGDKGWRECGACVELESADHNEWKLAVKFSGTTKFSYKAYQFLQSGSANRYTHAMMWRGGKDWALEFPDRNQWVLFKEMHEECFNRNLRAASVKNIPIPGVRPIEVCDATGMELPFVRNSDYIRQVETDAEMAMDPSHVLYDMDSEDEMWISGVKKSSLVYGSECKEVTEELFERTMDMLEKVAFVQQRDDFQLDEIEEFMVEIGPMESIRTIYEHWQRKRLQKGMPLIRHLQPPLWENYQQQVKEWEQVMARSNKAPPLEKPPMFAFCLKPRGLEMPNKGSKQRSHRRYPVSGNNYSLLGDHDGLYASGQRSNGYGYYGDEKVMFLGINTHECSDTSPSSKPSTRVFSPRDAGGFGQLSTSNGLTEWNPRPRFHRNKSKNVGLIRSPNNVNLLGPYNQRTVGKRKGVNRLNTNLPKWPSQRRGHSEVSLRYGLEQLDGSDLDEFRLRDASGAAQHALNMARLKREKAQRLLYRADLATHKAAVALMTADAIKASYKDLSDDEDSDDDESTEDDYSGDDETEDDDSNDSDRTR